jgi:glycosyltransferase involved in cell wall biosynthesis
MSAAEPTTVLERRPLSPASARAVRPDPIRVHIVYQTDPQGVIAGGIDTFIRGMVRNAPADFDMGIIGLTADPVARPVGRWSRCEVDGRTVGFFPVGELGDTTRRSRVPLTVRVAAGALRHRAAVAEADVLDFHRPESALPLLWTDRVRHCYIHQNMVSLKSRHADIKWAAAPSLYYRLEATAFRRMDRVWCVREDAAHAYRERFPEFAGRFAFLPTWTDPATFHPAAGDHRATRAAAFEPAWGLDASHEVAIAVGRLDRQKNPGMMIEAFARVAASRPALRLVLVGDGVLRADVERQIAEAGLGSRIVLAGLQPPARIAAMLRASDVYLMSSGYEGMPISVLEALASGLPVVSTDVGEVPRVVAGGRSGEVVAEQTAPALADGLARVLADRARYTRAACVASAAPFTPGKVLGSVFDAYREDVARLSAARRA